MNARVVALVALAAAVTLTSVAAAASRSETAGGDRPEALAAEDVCITPLHWIPEARLGRDSQPSEITAHDVMRDGQKVTIFDGGVVTLTGRREPSRFETGRVGHLERDGMATVRTTPSPSGPGRSCAVPASTRASSGRGDGHVGLGSPWYARYEGFLTAS